jgi:curved DNA-binding protein CbpA
MAEMVDLYELLQVHRSAERKVIQAAYRRLARKYHPDHYVGSQERMVAINGAWAVLGNAAERASYDRRRESPVPTQSSPSPYKRDQARSITTPPPPGKRAGTVLDFGRYAGWSLAQILERDPDFLEWLVRTPIGRTHQLEIGALLAARPVPEPFPSKRSPRRVRSSFGRRLSRFA